MQDLKFSLAAMTMYGQPPPDASPDDSLGLDFSRADRNIIQ
jgi:hypothetical protein